MTTIKINDPDVTIEGRTVESDGNNAIVISDTAHDVKLTGDVITGLGTNLVKISGSSVILDGCDFTQAGASHALLALTGAQAHDIVVRNCVFTNQWDRALLAVMTDTDNSGHVLLEHNIFLNCLWDGVSQSPFPDDPEGGGTEVIRLNMSHVIVRDNLILNSNVGNGHQGVCAIQMLAFTSGGNKFYCEHVRAYHNVILNSAINGVRFRKYSAVPLDYIQDNVFVNNIIWGSGEVDVYEENEGFGYVFQSNIMSTVKIGGKVMSVEEAERGDPEKFSGNINQAPVFVDSQNSDLFKGYALAQRVPAVGLTEIVNANGSVLEVEDSLYFVTGDEIEAAGEVLTIVSMAGNVLTLDGEPMASPGDPVFLAGFSDVGIKQKPLLLRVVWKKGLNLRPSPTMFNRASGYLSEGMEVAPLQIVTNDEGTFAEFGRGWWIAMDLVYNDDIYAVFC